MVWCEPKFIIWKPPEAAEISTKAFAPDATKDIILHGQKAGLKKEQVC
jgi:hypothetical protein